jgi:hypothetical protein
MLNPKFKAFKSVYSFIGLKQINALVKLWWIIFLSNVVEMPPCISPSVRIWNCRRLAKGWKFLFQHFEMIIMANEPTKELLNTKLQCSKGTKLMQRTLIVFWSDEENRNPFFQLLISMPITFLGLCLIPNWN